MSLAGVDDDEPSTPKTTATPSEGASTTTTATAEPMSADDVMADVMADPEFLQQVLTDLPGVDPSSDAVKSVMGNIQKGSKNKKDDKDSGEGSGESAAKKPRKDNN
eukprot:sb/3477857/